MEMEMEVVDLNATEAVMERLASAAAALERALERLAAVEVRASQGELEERLAEAEAAIATMRAGGRKTAAAGTMLAKESGGVEAAGMDAALGCLSLEQRIAVKAGLMRAGLLG